MILRRSLLAVSAALCCAGGATAAEASSAAGPADRYCRAPHGIVAKQGAVTVVRLTTGTIVACRRGRGPVAMVPRSSRDARFSLGGMAINGSVVAWVREYRGRETGQEVFACDLRTHRGIADGIRTSTGREIVAVRLTKAGVAWAVRADNPSDQYVAVADSRGPRIAAGGADVNLNSLGLSDEGAYWLNGGVPTFEPLAGGVGSGPRRCPPASRPGRI